MRKFVLYAAILVAGTVAGIWASNGAIWHAISGSPDLGREDFTEADRPINQFVACSPEAGCASPDLAIAAFGVEPAAMIARLDAIAAEQSRSVRVDDGTDPLHRRYVVRSAVFRFPDTVSIDAVPTDGGTALRISSRSQIGESDLGVNGERVRAWLAALGT